MSVEKLDPRKAFGSAVTGVAADNERVVVLSADSGGASSGLTEFIKLYPDRYLEFGIMEQGATGVASGLATMGCIPIFCAIAPFVTSRNFEMFRNDLGYMRQNAKIVGRNGGFTYSDLGATHHSLEDYAIIRMIPGVVVLSPQDCGEIAGAVKAMVEHEGPTFMRIGNQPLPNLFDPDEPFVIGKGRQIREGSDLTMVSTGYITGRAAEAADLLAEAGVSVDLIGMPTISPIDEEIILASAAKTGRVVTVEEHYKQGGLGGVVAELLCRELPTKMDMIGVPHDYATSGPYEDLLAYYKLNGPGIRDQVVELLG